MDYARLAVSSATNLFSRAISRDPEVFPDPEAFNPLRWLDSNRKLKTDIRFQSFGFGRR